MIKRAYILAKQMKEFGSLALRARAFLFLATPHRGADLASLLSKILTVCMGPRPFINDLHRNSLATQSINDEFPQHCQDLQLCSFYETIPTSLGLSKTLIVEKDLATLGYANERTAYLNANHRGVCKFTSEMDPNYLIVRNALVSIIDGFRDEKDASKQAISNEQQRVLDNVLGISDAPEDDLMDVDARRITGSCEWLLGKTSFQAWRDFADTQVYWVFAKPATGKTVLSGKVIHHLRGLQQDISFYFFDYRNKEKTTINSFLLSMVWQMAHLNSGVFQTVLEACEKDDQLCKADYRTLWRKLFVESILRLKFGRPQFWIIDALDECTKGPELVPLLMKIAESCSVRIFLTSRDRFESHRQALHPKARVASEEIQKHDTSADIALYLKANMDDLPSIDEETRQDMMAKILAKSNGCFLWVRLILQELRRVHTAAEIRKVLEDVPSNMSELYSQILESMSHAPYGKKLAKAILTWTVCPTRCLSTAELHHALELDMKDSVDSIERSIGSSCGQLVTVDQHSRVQMVHQTARDFLLGSGSNSEFAVDEKQGHKQLTMTCLKYLSSHELKGPRHRKLSATRAVSQRGPFLNYASDAFFEHSILVPSTDDEVLFALYKFLSSSNVLSWIEHIAEHSDLGRLIQAGKAFKRFLRKRAALSPLMGREVDLLSLWATDLVRLVTKFGTNLTTAPKSIFHLIPPFCPPDSAPRKLFASSTRGMTVNGLSDRTWDDCLSTIVYAQETFSALACSNNYFALGTSSGKIVIHNQLTCQRIRDVNHQEPVRILRFAEKADLLVAAGYKVVCLWNTSSWEELWRLQIPQLCMSVAFVEENRLLLGALRNNHLMIWDLDTGLLRDSADWTLDLEGPGANAYRRPIAADLSVEHAVLAVVYRGQDVILWDLERDALHGSYCKEAGLRPSDQSSRPSAGIIGVLFGSAAAASTLFVSYADGDLVLFDSLEGTVMANTTANAHTLALSPDGRSLACGDSSGTIQLFQGDTLRLLYSVRSDEYCPQALAFSADGHHLLDIRGSLCRVWDPPILMREDVDDDNSDSVSVTTLPQEVSSKPSQDVVLITSLACYDQEGIFFCGKENGSVYLFEMKTGRQCYKLFTQTANVAILDISFDEKNQTLSSFDTASRIMVQTLSRRSQRWEIAEVLFDHREGFAVDQVISNDQFSSLLVCTAQKSTLWSLSMKESRKIKDLCWEDRCPHKWISHPLHPNRLIHMTQSHVHLYDWQTFERLTDDPGILLQGSILPELVIRSITPCFGGAVLATAFSDTLRPYADSKLLLWSTLDFTPDSKSAAPVPRYRSLADRVKHLIGDDGQKVVFLDSSNWVCSSNLQSSNEEKYSRHFFLPAGWVTMTVDLQCRVTCNGDILVVKHDEVAVIKRGFDNVEQDADGNRGKRPLLLGPTKWE